MEAATQWRSRALDLLHVASISNNKEIKQLCTQLALEFNKRAYEEWDRELEKAPPSRWGLQQEKAERVDLPPRHPSYVEHAHGLIGLAGLLRFYIGECRGADFVDAVSRQNDFAVIGLVALCLLSAIYLSSQARFVFAFCKAHFAP